MHRPRVNVTGPEFMYPQLDVLVHENIPHKHITQKLKFQTLIKVGEARCAQLIYFFTLKYRKIKVKMHNPDNSSVFKVQATVFYRRTNKLFP